MIWIACGLHAEHGFRATWISETLGRMGSGGKWAAPICLLLASSALGGCGLLLGASGDDAPPGRDAGDADASLMMTADGSVAGDGAASDGGGAPDDGGAADATVPCTPGCRLDPSRLLAPVMLATTGFPDPAHWSPALSADGLTLLFDTYESATGNDIWIATRADACAPFGPATPTTLNTGDREAGASLSSDGLELFYSTNPMRGANADIYVVRRTAPDGPFLTPQPVAAVNDRGAWDEDPFVSADGLRLYFSSNRTGGMGLYVAERASREAPFGAAVLLEGAVNTTAGDRFPTLTEDELTMYFSSDRPGGAGGYDIWVARRPTRSEPFGEPQNLGPIVNTPEDDVYPFLSRDGTTLYFNWQTDLFDGAAAMPGYVWTVTSDCAP